MRYVIELRRMRRWRHRPPGAADAVVVVQAVPDDGEPLSRLDATRARRRGIHWRQVGWCRYDERGPGSLYAQAWQRAEAWIAADRQEEGADG